MVLIPQIRFKAVTFIAFTVISLLGFAGTVWALEVLVLIPF